jgi:hypothetical protein
MPSSVSSGTTQRNVRCLCQETTANAKRPTKTNTASVASDHSRALTPGCCARRNPVKVQSRGLAMPRRAKPKGKATIAAENSIGHQLIASGWPSFEIRVPINVNVHVFPCGRFHYTSSDPSR